MQQSKQQAAARDMTTLPTICPSRDQGGDTVACKYERMTLPTRCPSRDQGDITVAPTGRREDSRSQLLGMPWPCVWYYLAPAINISNTQSSENLQFVRIISSVNYLDALTLNYLDASRLYRIIKIAKVSRFDIIALGRVDSNVLVNPSGHRRREIDCLTVDLGPTSIVCRQAPLVPPHSQPSPELNRGNTRGLNTCQV